MPHNKIPAAGDVLHEIFAFKCPLLATSLLTFCSDISLDGFRSGATTESRMWGFILIRLRSAQGSLQYVLYKKKLV